VRSGFNPNVTEIEAMRNFGPKSSGWLIQAGITTRAELARVGAIEACRRMLRASHPVTVIMAYAIEAALMNCDWRSLPLEFRKQLRLEFRALRRETKKQ
jgi:hypothetical protein